MVLLLQVTIQTGGLSEEVGVGQWMAVVFFILSFVAGKAGCCPVATGDNLKSLTYIHLFAGCLV